MPDGQFLGRRWPWKTGLFGWLPGVATAQEEEEKGIYLERIYYYINSLVQQGSMTRAEGVSVLRHADETSQNWSRREELPYFEEIMVPAWEWYEKTAGIQTAQRKDWLGTQKKEALKREYLPQLKAYLDYGVSKGQITPRQREESMAYETQRIDLGMPLKDLPTYTGVQDYQTYQTEVEKRQQQMLKAFGGEAKRRGWEEAGQRMGLQQRIWARGREGRESAQEKIRREMEAEFGGEEFTGPVNWIKKWFAEHRPQRRAEEGLGEEIARIEAQRIVGPGKEFADWGEREVRLTELRAAQKGAGGPGYVGVGPPEARRKREEPTAPATPGWLAELTGLRAGEPIRKLPVTTPSAQWFTRQPWSVREGLRGYTEWAGGRAYEDIVEEMYRMLPQEPRGRATRWRAPKQWA